MRQAAYKEQVGKVYVERTDRRRGVVSLRETRHARPDLA
jgi:hypothetical protein